MSSSEKYESPDPQFIVAGAPKTLELCARYGDGWIPIGYTELFKHHAGVIKKLAKENGRELDGFTSQTMSIYTSRMMERRLGIR